MLDRWCHFLLSFQRESKHKVKLIDKICDGGMTQTYY